MQELGLRILMCETLEDGTVMARGVGAEVRDEHLKHCSNRPSLEPDAWSRTAFRFMKSSSAASVHTLKVQHDLQSPNLNGFAPSRFD